MLLHIGSALASKGCKVRFFAPAGDLLDKAREYPKLICTEMPSLARKDNRTILQHAYSIIRANIILIKQTWHVKGTILINAPRAWVYLSMALLPFWIKRFSLAHDVVSSFSYDRIFVFCMKTLGIKVLPVSKAIARSLGVPDRYVLQNPVFIGKFSGGRRPHRLVRFGIISNIAEWKGHLLVLEAIESLIDSEADLSYEIYGRVLDAREEQYLRKIMDKVRQIPTASFNGYTKSPWQTYCQLDVVIQSSLRSEQPLTLSEAISAGCYVISPKGGGEEEVIRNWPYVTWYERGNVASLREAIIKVIKIIRERGVEATYQDYEVWRKGYTEDDWIKKFLQLVR